MVSCKAMFLCIVVVFYLFVMFLFMRGFEGSAFLYEIFLVLSVMSFLSLYRDKNKKSLIQDLYFVTRFFSIHALVGFLFALFFIDFFSIEVGTNRSFLYLLYVSKASIMGIHRNSGFFWEPGLLQICANIYFFCAVISSRSKFDLVISSAVIMTTFSTSGLVIYCMNISYLFYKFGSNRKSLVFRFLLLIIVFLFFVPFARENINDKVYGENRTSGLIRLRDLVLGVELVKDKPFMGHGFYSDEYLSSLDYVWNLELDVMSSSWIESSGVMAGGFTNGFFSIFSYIGIPLSVLLFYGLFNNCFLECDKLSRLVFMLIILLTMISEPIGNTSFFYMFPFSFFLLNRSKNDKCNCSNL